VAASARCLAPAASRLPLIAPAMLLPLPAYGCAKRALDIVLSATALLVLLPLFIPLMVVLRLTGEGEVCYRQERVGYRGNRFGLLKFVTMLKDSPNLGSKTITTKNDPRVLPLGRWLRKTKINELPQLINVLKGDMSIVGPRPQTEECFAYFPEKDRDRICLAKPGLTGIGSVVFRDEEEIVARSGKSYDRAFREDVQPYKLALEIWYIEHQSFWLDLKLMFITAWVIVFPRSTIYRRWLKGLPLPR
jgi:lipopolysaccharide/colanic/teichoic acid biosynthesis glycosyltransferase